MLFSRQSFIGDKISYIEDTDNVSHFGCSSMSQRTSVYLFYKNCFIFAENMYFSPRTLNIPSSYTIRFRHSLLENKQNSILNPQKIFFHKNKKDMKVIHSWKFFLQIKLRSEDSLFRRLKDVEQ